MKKTYLFLIVAVAGAFLFAGTSIPKKSVNGFTLGTPEIKSMSAITFGANGVLFIGDSKSASVFAVDTKDSKSVAKAAAIEVKGIDEKIAEALGTQKENIKIMDMAVNPVSKKVYLAVQNSDGTPVLLKLEGDKLQAVSLKDVNYSTVALNNAPAEDAKDQRGGLLRVSSISDIGFSDGKVYVSGLSNKQFSSSFSSISFPFSEKQEQATLEIYHAAHGRFETASPIKTFTTGEINGKKYLIASYTCTPLVLFPLDELKAGQHVKGRTVAEMGSGNTPLDMITVKKGNESVLIMTNTKYPVAAVSYKNLAAFQGTLTERVATTAGVDFAKLPLLAVTQIDKLDDTHVLMIQNRAGSVDLWTANDQTL